MKTIELFFHVVQFIMLYKVGLSFRSVDKTLVRDHSVYSAVQGGSNFEVWLKTLLWLTF